MLRDTAVTLLKGRLGNRTDLDDMIIAEMQLVQQDLESDAALMPWFLLSSTEQVQTTVGEERIALPANFLAEYEEGALWLYNPQPTTIAGIDQPNKTWIKLKKEDLDFLREFEDISGYPKVYALTGNYFRLGPVPDAVYSLRFQYYAEDAVLSTNIENGWLKYAAELIISMTGFRIAFHLQDPNMADRFEKAKEAAYVDLLTQITARKVGNSRLTMRYK